MLCMIFAVFKQGKQNWMPFNQGDIRTQMGHEQTVMTQTGSRIN